MDLHPLAQIYAPRLRLMARALTGDQENGDGVVVTVLDANIDLNSGSVNKTEMPAELYRRLSTALHRQHNCSLRSLLEFLSTFENLDENEISRVLEISQSEVARLHEEGAKSGKPTARRVLVVESESSIAAIVKPILVAEGYRDVEIAGTCRKAIDMRRSFNPDLVLADLQLADGSTGVEAAIEILQAFEVPCVFMTAFPERLLTGTAPEPAYIVPKPFTPEMIRLMARLASMRLPALSEVPSR